MRCRYFAITGSLVLCTQQLVQTCSERDAGHATHRRRGQDLLEPERRVLHHPAAFAIAGEVAQREQCCIDATLQRLASAPGKKHGWRTDPSGRGRAIMPHRVQQRFHRLPAHHVRHQQRPDPTTHARDSKHTSNRIGAGLDVRVAHEVAEGSGGIGARLLLLVVQQQHEGRDRWPQGVVRLAQPQPSATDHESNGCGMRVPSRCGSWRCPPRSTQTCACSCPATRTIPSRGDLADQEWSARAHRVGEAREEPRQQLLPQQRRIAVRRVPAQVPEQVARLRPHRRLLVREQRLDLAVDLGAVDVGVVVLVGARELAHEQQRVDEQRRRVATVQQPG